MRSFTQATSAIWRIFFKSFPAIVFLLLVPCFAFGQMDQGSVTGIVQDTTGAVVPNAQVTLKSTDTGLELQTKTDQNGVYTFSPVKIGNYQVSVTAPGFQTTTQANLHLDVQQRLAVNVQLQPGEATETVEVTAAPPLMQTEEGSTGQVMDTKTINDTPLNGRNWVFIAQLAAGAAPPSGSRGAGKGDFNANGQRAEQNAVINASIKSGTNDIHGDLWEYIRNDAFDIHDFDATPESCRSTVKTSLAQRLVFRLSRTSCSSLAMWRRTALFSARRIPDRPFLLH